MLRTDQRAMPAGPTFTENYIQSSIQFQSVLFDVVRMEIESMDFIDPIVDKIFDKSIPHCL